MCINGRVNLAQFVVLKANLAEKVVCVFPYANKHEMTVPFPLPYLLISDTSVSASTRLRRSF
jgi:hypothetical protein